MNVGTALFHENGKDSARSGVGSTRGRNGFAAPGKEQWFTSVASEQHVRDLVAQNFMSMNQAHDQIRSELLASRDAETH